MLQKLKIIFKMAQNNPLPNHNHDEFILGGKSSYQKVTFPNKDRLKKRPKRSAAQWLLTGIASLFLLVTFIYGTRQINEDLSQLSPNILQNEAQLSAENNEQIRNVGQSYLANTLTIHANQPKQFYADVTPLKARFTLLNNKLENNEVGTSKLIHQTEIKITSKNQVSTLLALIKNRNACIKNSLKVNIVQPNGKQVYQYDEYSLSEINTFIQQIDNYTLNYSEYQNYQAKLEIKLKSNTLQTTLAELDESDIIDDIYFENGKPKSLEDK